MIETYLPEELAAVEKEGTLLKVSEKLNVTQPEFSHLHSERPRRRSNS